MSTFKKQLEQAIEEHGHDWDMYFPSIEIESNYVESRRWYNIFNRVLQNPDNHFEYVIVTEQVPSTELQYIEDLDLPTVQEAEPVEVTTTKYIPKV